MNFYLQNFVLVNVFLCLLLVGGMVGLTWLGHRAGRKWFGGNDAATAGWGTLEAAMLGLFGLLMAFSFSGAADRFQNRRDQIVQQAQAIGTAYDRLELLDPASREPIRKLFREYLDLQLGIFQDFKDVETLIGKLDALEAKGAEIFRLSAAACREERHHHLAEVIPPAVNEMLDVSVARRASLHIHLPAVVFYLLFAMALGTGLLAGFGMTPAPRINWFHATTFAFFAAVTIFVIMDMDFPRAGLFKVEAADEALRLARRAMH